MVVQASTRLCGFDMRRTPTGTRRRNGGAGLDETVRIRTFSESSIGSTGGSTTISFMLNDLMSE